MKVRIVEHKTSTEDITSGSSYWKKLTLDVQLNVYLTGARALGHDPVGILYDVARRPTLQPYTATPVESRKYTLPKDRACKGCKKNPGVTHTEDVDGAQVECRDGRIVTAPGGKLYANLRDTDETPEEFRERLRGDIAENPDKYYQRGDIVRLAGEESAAAKNTWILARWIREVQLESGGDASAWPQNVDACHAYNSECEFWGVCSGTEVVENPYLFKRSDAHSELEDDGKRHLPIVTMSSMKTFRSCPRKYFYRYEQGYKSTKTSEALRFGTLFHLGLEAWWKTRSVDDALAAMRAGVAADAFELVKAEELMLGYHFRWEDEPHVTVAVEAQFEAPLVNPTTGAASKTWNLSGKIDAIIEAA